MKTSGEIDAQGRIVRIFHRTATAAWTHAPGERYQYRTKAGGWVEMRCDCAVSESWNALSDEVGVRTEHDDYPDAVAEAERLGLMRDGNATARCLCPECGEVFSTESNFDRHLQPAAVRFADDYDGPWCRPPAQVGLVRSEGKPWHLPGPEVRSWGTAAIVTPQSESPRVHHVRGPSATSVKGLPRDGDYPAPTTSAT